MTDADRDRCARLARAIGRGPKECPEWWGDYGCPNCDSNESVMSTWQGDRHWCKHCGWKCDRNLPGNMRKLPSHKMPNLLTPGPAAEWLMPFIVSKRWHIEIHEHGTYVCDKTGECRFMDELFGYALAEVVEALGKENT